MKLNCRHSSLLLAALLAASALSCADRGRDASAEPIADATTSEPANAEGPPGDGGALGPDSASDEVGPIADATASDPSLDDAGASPPATPGDAAFDPPSTSVDASADESADAGVDASRGRRDGSIRDANEPAPSEDAGRADARAEAPDDGCPAQAARPVDRVRIWPAAGRAEELRGARIQGSNTGPTLDFVDLATVESAPAEGAFTELRFANTRLFRYLKLYVEGARGAVAEIEFYHGERRLEGAPFGTVGAAGATYARAFDGDPRTAFEGPLERGNYVGIHAAASLSVAAPSATPSAGTYDTLPSVMLASATAGATIRYTLDGSAPSRSAGTLLSGAIALPNVSTTLRAIAYKNCLFDSPIASFAYTVRPAAPPPTMSKVKSYHIGNSLTDTIQEHMEEVAASAGAQHTYTRWTIPGAPVAEIWKNKGVGFGTPDGAEYIDQFARTAAPIDHMFVQPYADPSLEPQAGAAIAMFDVVRASSPNVQFWVYAQWAPKDSWADNALATGAGWAKPAWSVPSQPTSWESATANQLLYHEAFRAYVDERAPGKSVRVVPAGPAMVRLKRAVESGQVPGMSNFFREHFLDDEHLTQKGQYFVTLVFYACMYGQSPEGRVRYVVPGLSDPQAEAYKRIAWESVREYAWSGVR